MKFTIPYDRDLQDIEQFKPCIHGGILHKKGFTVQFT